MQQIDPETRFLAALAEAAAAELGADHPLTLAARAPQRPAQAARVHELLAEQDEALRERILAAAHRTMREDIAAICGLLPGAAQSGGIH